MSKLLKLYESMADYVGLKFDSDGFLVVEKSTGTEPVQYDGNRILLPTNQNLKRNLVGENIWFFHPLCEGAFEDESDIAQAYRQQLNVRLNMVVNCIIISILGTAAKDSASNDLTPSQLDLVVKLKGVDGTTLKNMNKYIRQTKFDRGVLNVFVSKGARKDGKRYPRLGSTNFGLYRSLIDGKAPEFFRAKDLTPIIEIHRYLFPEIDIENAYMYGSSSTIAPYTDALLRTAKQITDRLNEVMKVWHDYLINQDVMFDHSWVDYYEDQEGLLKEIRLIPMQKGSTSTVTPVEPPTPVKKPLAQTTNSSISPWEDQPHVVQAPPQVQPPVYYQQPPLVTQPQQQYQMGYGYPPAPQQMPNGMVPGYGYPGVMQPMPNNMVVGVQQPVMHNPNQPVFVPTGTGMLVPMHKSVAPYFTGGGFSRQV